MAIKRKKIPKVSSPPKTYVSIVAEDGASLTQTVNVASGEVYPDRRLTPLVLTPVVGYKVAASGEQSDNAASLLTNGRWYRLSKATASTGPTAQNEIINGMPLTGGIAPHTNKFEIDTTLGSATYGRLKVYENSDSDDPPTYLFVARLNVGDGVDVSGAKRTNATAIETLPTLSFDNAMESLYNPWQDTRYFTIHPVIAPSGYQAYFNWESYHEGEWNALFLTHYDWAITRDGNGVKIDRSMMQDIIRLRCIATVNVGGATLTLMEYVTHTRRLPWFDWDWYGLAGLPESAKTLHPHLDITCSQGKITAAADLAQLIIEWFGTSDTVPVATGAAPDIPLSALGTARDLGLSVRDRGGHKSIVSGDGKYHYVTNDGSPIIIQAPD